MSEAAATVDFLVPHFLATVGSQKDLFYVTWSAMGLEKSSPPIFYIPKKPKRYVFYLGTL